MRPSSTRLPVSAPLAAGTRSIARTSAVSQFQEPELSLTERYRGTEFDIATQQLSMHESSGFSRGRAFVLVALVFGVALYGVVISAMGLF